MAENCNRVFVDTRYAGSFSVQGVADIKIPGSKNPILRMNRRYCRDRAYYNYKLNWGQCLDRCRKDSRCNYIGWYYYRSTSYYCRLYTANCRSSSSHTYYKFYQMTPTNAVKRAISSPIGWTVTQSCESARIIVPKLKSTTITIPSGTIVRYKFPAFIYSGPSSCGWKEPYRVTVTSGDKSKIKYPGNNYKITQCSNSFTSSYCVYIDIDTRTSSTWKVTFTSNIRSGKPSTASYSLNFVAKCGSTSTNIAPLNAEGKSPLLKRTGSSYTTMNMI
jgi:hypothetical protein